MKTSELVGKKVLVAVDGVEHETVVSKVDFIGIDLENFGDDNEWSDGKHYAGIMSCLNSIFEDGVLSVEKDRKGSSYSVKIAE